MLQTSLNKAGKMLQYLYQEGESDAKKRSKLSFYSRYETIKFYERQ